MNLKNNYPDASSSKHRCPKALMEAYQTLWCFRSGTKRNFQIPVILLCLAVFAVPSSCYLPTEFQNIMQQQVLKTQYPG